MPPFTYTGGASWPPGKGGWLMNYVTYSDLIQIGILIVSLFVLFQGNKKK